MDTKLTVSSVNTALDTKKAYQAYHFGKPGIDLLKHRQHKIIIIIMTAPLKYPPVVCVPFLIFSSYSPCTGKKEMCLWLEEGFTKRHLHKLGSSAACL